MADAGREQISHWFRNDPALAHVPLVDTKGRPQGVLARDRYFAGDTRPSPPLLAFAEDAPADLARRAMARPHPARFDPIIYCDETGRYLGLIGIEQLIEVLAG